MMSWRRVRSLLLAGVLLSALPPVPDDRPLFSAKADVQGGSIANRNGAAFEKHIEDIFTDLGIVVVSHRQWQANPHQYPSDVLLKNAPYHNIYGRTGRSEFVLISKRLGHPVRIEAKWSQGPGSHDEKLVYTYLNAVEAMPEPLVLIVIGGGVWRDGSIEWLEQAAQTERYEPASKKSIKQVRIFRLRELQTWAWSLYGKSD